MKSIKILKGYKPILYWRRRILLYKAGVFYISNLELTDIKFLSKLPVGKLIQMLLCVRIFVRLFRLDAGAACLLDDGVSCLICFWGVIYKLNLLDGAIVKDFKIPNGRGPLQFSSINLEGFVQGIYFGEYISNPEKKEVAIYCRSQSGDWRILYKFLPGELNHVHNIISDKRLGVLYILTGDFLEAAAIWEVKDGFNTVRRIHADGQKSRACWLKVIDHKLVYATDTQMELNYLVRSDRTANGFENIEPFQLLMGSSIYSMHHINDLLIFSTAVEPSKMDGKFLGYLSNRFGMGNIDNTAHIYAGNMLDGVASIYSAEKDSWSMRLFQFGTFQFPAGISSDENFIHAYGVSLKGVDGDTIMLKLKE